jgi:hypothetical protein
MTDRGNKGYIPWHEKVNESLVKELTEQFVQRIFKEAGMRVGIVHVNWSEDGADFNANAYGLPTDKKAPN